MADIDTKPLESVQAALTLFEQTVDHNRFSPNRNEEAIDCLTKELSNYKLQLEVKENEIKQVNLKLEVLQNAMEDLSATYSAKCLDAFNRIIQLEGDNSMLRSQQSEVVAECNALKDELVHVKEELDTVKESNAVVLQQAKLMEAAMGAERENTKEALMRILKLNEAVLSSAVAAMRAEEERSVFFQEMTLDVFKSDQNLVAVRRQQEMIESLENKVLAKTVKIDRLRSELMEVKELYVSSQVSDATVDKTGGTNTNDQDCGTIANGQEAFSVTEISRVDRKMEGEMSEDVVEDKEPEAVIMVPDSMVLEGNSDGPEAFLVTKNSRDDYYTIQSTGQNMDTIKLENNDGNQEPQSETTVPNSACKGISEAASACFVAEIFMEDFQAIQSDDTNINNDIMPENVVEDYEESKADKYFVTEIFTENCQAIQSDDRNINGTMSENVVEDYEESEADTYLVTEILTEIQSDDRDITCAMSENIVEDHLESTADTCLVTEILTEDCQTIQFDDRNINCTMPENVVEDHEEPKVETCSVTEMLGEDCQSIQSDDRKLNTAMSENVVEDHEEPKADACFVNESSRDDFQTVQSDEKNINISISENIAGNKDTQAEVTVPNSTLCQYNSEAADTCFVTDITREEGDFYTKEPGQANKLDGYVIVTKKCESDALKDELDAAHTEISDLKFSLEEAVRRAELAEKAKAEMETQLKERKQKMAMSQRPPQAPSESISTVVHEETPALQQPTPSWKPAPPRGSKSAPRGDERPLSYVTIGQVLNMKYK